MNHFTIFLIFISLIISTESAGLLSSIFGNNTAHKCGENEEFLKCGTACEAQCSEGLVMFCTRQCVVDVCQCKKGFLRNKDKKCVSKDKCK